MYTQLSNRFRAEVVTLPYATSFFPSLLVITGNLSGGWYAAANMLFSLVILVLVDWLLPVSAAKHPHAAAKLPTIILVLSVLLHTACITSLLFGVYAGILTGKFIWLATISTGLNAGAMGITAAHELIHRKEKGLQSLGIWSLFLTNNPHFYIEHRLGHHLRVGTWDDPATARFNESYYQFVFRTIPGQWRSALDIEAKRLHKKREAAYSLKNFVVRAIALQVLSMALLYVLLGATVFWAYFWQSIIAVLLLEFVNYIEHYGLVRAKGAKVAAHHAWQSDRISSRFTLFELSRHSDHHIKAYKPFHTLESHEGGFFLPSGYYGMFYLSLIPPLWFRVMNPIIEKQQKSAEPI